MDIEEKNGNKNLLPNGMTQTEYDDFMENHRKSDIRWKYLWIPLIVISPFIIIPLFSPSSNEPADWEVRRAINKKIKQENEITCLNLGYDYYDQESMSCEDY